MGDPKRNKKKYQSPGNLWNAQRIKDESKIVEKYGLKTRTEIWKARTQINNKRQNARKLLAMPLEQRLVREKELLASLTKKGLVDQQAVLDDILGLKLEDILERRLQSVVWRKGIALTPKQARQFIVHGKIGVNGKRVNAPSYLVRAGEEDTVRFYGTPVELNYAKKQETKKKFEGIVPEAGQKEKIDPAVIEEVAEEVKEIEKLESNLAEEMEGEDK